MIELAVGDATLLLCPDAGGAIGGWTRRGVPILRPSPAAALAGSNARPLSCFPLIPFSNRVAWGRFSFGGESFQLQPNFDDEPHAIHGNGWQRAWTVASQSAAEAELALHHDPAHDPTAPAGTCHWPYRYAASLHYALHPDGLAVTIGFTNTDSRAQPVGLGLHPYQPRTPQTAIEFRAGSVWHVAPDLLPDARLAADGAWSFEPGHVIGEQALDNCYAGWSGRAVVTRPEHGVRVTIAADDIFRHVVAYTPAAKPYFAVEPASNMTDAVNRMDTVADHGLRVLQPGDTLKRQVRFSVEDL